MCALARKESCLIWQRCNFWLDWAHGWAADNWTMLQEWFYKCLWTFWYIFSRCSHFVSKLTSAAALCNFPSYHVAAGECLILKMKIFSLVETLGWEGFEKRKSSVKARINPAETVKYSLATNFSFLRRNFTF